ncbi:EF-hand domain-containing protein [Luteolibacter soli]|uniref:EF-hand domain-containing protein n=1 Tax=Luteolibacter soli TaxID=3135280 RepID=A0ABU9AX32_9BACT
MHVPKLLPFAVFATLAFVPTAPAAGNGALDRRFDKADINDNGEVDSTEFLALEPRSKSWVEAIYRFNLADIDHNGGLSLTEFRASNGGKEGGKPSRSQKFALADADEDGFLDPEEFARTLAQSKPWRKVLRDFGRKDHNDDSQLSFQEFGGGIVTPF